MGPCRPPESARGDPTLTATMMNRERHAQWNIKACTMEYGGVCGRGRGGVGWGELVLGEGVEWLTWPHQRNGREVHSDGASLWQGQAQLHHHRGEHTDNDCKEHHRREPLLPARQSWRGQIARHLFLAWLWLR
jgi:hypothetical protein